MPLQSFCEALPQTGKRMVFRPRMNADKRKWEFAFIGVHPRPCENLPRSHHLCEFKYAGTANLVEHALLRATAASAAARRQSVAVACFSETHPSKVLPRPWGRPFGLPRAGGTACPTRVSDPGDGPPRPAYAEACSTSLLRLCRAVLLSSIFFAACDDSQAAKLNAES